MTIIVIDPVLGTGAPAVIGSAVPAGTTRKFTKTVAHNPTGGTVAIKVFLVPSGQSADDLHTYVDYDLVSRETYLCPEVVGSGLQAGGTLQVQGVGVSFSAVASDTK